MAEFAGYGFNKSHSCAYALLAYQTAWLKTHYPVEFMAAMLTSETGNTEKVVKYINEARSMGITVLPPDVNSSDVDFTPTGDQIRFGLCAIKNVGENTVKGILAARETLGRFTDFFEFRGIGGYAAVEQARARKPDPRWGDGRARRAPRADDGGDRPRHGTRAKNAARARKRPARIVRRRLIDRPLRAAGTSAGSGGMAGARTTRRPNIPRSASTFPAIRSINMQAS